MGDRLAGFVHDATGDHCAARQREVDVLEHGAFPEIHRSASFEWTALSVRDFDIPAARGLELVAPRRELRQLISALGVRHGGGGPALIRRAPFIHADLHAAQRFTGVGTYDAPADHARSRAWPGGLVPCRHLCRGERADQEQAKDNSEG